MGCDNINFTIKEGIIKVQGATIDVGDTITVDPDQPAKVENVGTDENVILQFSIPRGQRGLTGLGLEFDWQDTQLGVRIEGEQDYQYVDLKGDKGDNLEFTWRGTELGVRVEGDEDYQYVDLKGEAATVNVGSTSTVNPGEPAKVTNSGDTHNAVFNFEIPKGDPLTYDDLTPAQITELQQPAIDAAQTANTAAGNANTAANNANDAAQDVEDALNGNLTYSNEGQVNTISITKDTETVTKYELTGNTQITISQPAEGAYTKVLIVEGDFTLDFPQEANRLASSEDYDSNSQNQIVILVSEDFINYSINPL